nr:Fic family protein [Anaerotardibacter muris]
MPNILTAIDSGKFAHKEERISKCKALELFDTGEIDKGEPGSFSSLAHIHEKLFEDIYDFAGKMRTEDISKGDFRFASALYLEESVSEVEALSQSTFDEIIKKYVEMNIVHPFREGNGRSMRLWLDQILKAELGLVVDCDRVSKDDYLHAMEHSPISEVEISCLLKESLTGKIDDRDVYMDGIDASFAFEGYNTFKTKELD